MEENKINNEEIIVTEEEKVVEAPKAEEPVVEEQKRPQRRSLRQKTPLKSLPLKKSLSPMMISRSSLMTW